MILAVVRDQRKNELHTYDMGWLTNISGKVCSKIVSVFTNYLAHRIIPQLLFRERQGNFLQVVV